MRKLASPVNFLGGEFFLSKPGGCDRPPSSEFDHWAARICKGERQIQVSPAVWCHLLYKSRLFTTKKICDSLYYITCISVLYRVSIRPRWSLCYAGRAESLRQTIWPAKPEILTNWPITENGTHIIYSRLHDGGIKKINTT